MTRRGTPIFAISYPEHVWGAWSDVADQLECKPDANGWFETPAHKVIPRGWHNGKYARFPWPRRPSFSGIGITANTGYFARVALEQNDLHKFENFELVVRVIDGWRTELRWEPKQARKWSTDHLCLNLSRVCNDFLGVTAARVRMTCDKACY
jgi:hypothetical protein